MKNWGWPGLLLCIMPLAMTAPHQMTCAMAVANRQVCRASSVKFVSDGDQNLNSNPQSTYVITHVVCQDLLKGIFFDLDLSPPASTPASPRRLRLTLVTPATLYMSLTSTSSPLYEWICPLSVSLTTQSQSSQPRGKPHYSTLGMGNHTRLLSN